MGHFRTFPAILRSSSPALFSKNPRTKPVLLVARGCNGCLMSRKVVGSDAACRL